MREDLCGEASVGKGRRIYPYVKRFFDVLIAFVSLTFLYIPMGIIALSIRISTGESSVFRQKRVGKDGRCFICYKFRTMRKSAPSQMASADFSDAQKYITPIGRFLRKSSLDELPQLFNVLGGDMSIVGPRPLIPLERDMHDMRKKGGADRALPGITGLAQIMGRDMLDNAHKADFDIAYSRDVSFLLDMKIFFKTFVCAYRQENILR